MQHERSGELRTRSSLLRATAVARRRPKISEMELTTVRRNEATADGDHRHYGVPMGNLAAQRSHLLRGGLEAQRHALT